MANKTEDREEYIPPSNPDACKLQFDRLSKAIEQFEDFLGSMQGRCDCRMNREDMSLWFTRKGRRWVIKVYDHDKAQPQSTDLQENWQLLTEASVRLKIKAVDYFPGFLDAMRNQRASAALAAKQAADKIQEFMRLAGESRAEIGGD